MPNIRALLLPNSLHHSRRLTFRPSLLLIHPYTKFHRIISIIRFPNTYVHSSIQSNKPTISAHLPFTFYATPLAILNFCTTGPHTDQDPDLWPLYVEHYLHPLSTFIDALTLERDFLVAAAKATNWASSFPLHGIH